MTFYKQPPELEEGNREYKLKLCDPTQERNERLASQMKYRLYEGEGKALYIIGVQDDGDPIGISEKELHLSIKNIEKVVKTIDGKIQNIRYYKGREGVIATVRVTLELEEALDALLLK